LTTSWTKPEQNSPAFLFDYRIIWAKWENCDEVHIDQDVGFELLAKIFFGSLVQIMQHYYA